MSIAPPKNSTALAFYLLFEAGLKGITNYQAVASDRFYKFSTRVSDLIKKHNVNIHKKSEEAGLNRFGHKIENIRYALYKNDFAKNLEIYNKINDSPQDSDALEYATLIEATKKKRSLIPTSFQKDLFE